ncbi:putative polysaccharide biosynthesis protein [Bacillus kwashiorkori]|uniref:putative polysaccharide biosynthesis protein n=1 Tax=Bacillus kwashiorkori TaxID=1522318 RepID=UPI000782259D|nr:polysaccharide biosynthesis protein [Bacillus kwashiorkori]
MSSKLLRGTFILTIGTYISKFLGLFYVIPFAALVGKQGAALYSYGYVPYNIFLSIGIGGIPLAVSKFVAKYNALGEYKVGRQLFKSGLLIMMTTGFITFLALYFLAPSLAGIIIPDDDLTSRPEDVVAVIRSISFALIVVPFMSLIRGFFQGHQSMGPSAVSQVIEQIVRITFLLAGAYIVLKVADGTVVDAVKIATFAAFVGAIGSLIVLIMYFIKRKPYLDELLEHDKGQMKISYREIYKEVINYSIPFIFVGLANPLFQLVDTLTFNQAMVQIGLADQSENYLATMNFYAHKLVIIPVSLATAFSLTLVPLITSAFVNQHRDSLQQQLDQTFQVVMFLTLPASLGISILAEPIYTVFYSHDILGANILAAYAPVAILFALFSVSAAILQGINEQRFTIFSLLLGLLMKLVLNIPLIKAFETYGAILATTIGYLVAIVINFIVIKHYTQYRLKLVIRRTILIFIFNAIMLVVVFFVYKFLHFFLSPESIIPSVLIILVCVIFAVVVYFYLGLKSKLIQLILGDQVQKIKRRLS